MTATVAPNPISIDAADYSVKSVKISKSCNAEVMRTFKLLLKKGQNALEIKGLPSLIGAVRPSVSGSAVRIDDFLFTVERSAQSAPLFGATAGPAAVSPTSTPETLRVLLVQEAELQSERAVKVQESQLLFKYGQTLSGEHVKPGDMAVFLESFTSQGRKSIQEVTMINEKIVDIMRKIEAEKARLALKAGETLGRVSVILSSEKDIETELTLTYIVFNCSWRPTYELHSTTEDGKPSSNISLHYLALVTQSTGEDWAGAELTLSTITSDLIPRRLPNAVPLKIRPATKPIFGQITEPVNAGAAPPATNFNAQLQRHANVHGNTTTLFGAAPGGFNQPSFGASQTGPSTFGLPAQAAAQNAQPAYGYSGFGRPAQAATQSPQPAYGSSLFGQPAQAAAPSTFGSQGAGLFGQPAQAAAPSTQTGFGSGLFGQPAQAVPTSAQSSSLFGGGAPVSSQTASGSAPALFTPPADSIPAAEETQEENTAEPLSEASSVVRETPLSMVFVVGTSSIPSDGLSHRVTLAVLPFKCHISYITIPRDDPTVFLQCAVTNTSEYRLLSGPMSVIVDDSYISATTIDDNINPGEAFECRFGTDISTKVTYTRTSKTVPTEASAFAEETDTTVYTTKISVHNKHAFDLADLVVRDRMPTCDDKRVKVLLRHPMALGTVRDGGAYAKIGEDGLKVGWEKLIRGKGGEKEGKFEWKWRVKSGETVEFRAEYEVKVPRGAAWVVQSWNSLFGV